MDTDLDDNWSTNGSPTLPEELTFQSFVGIQARVVLHGQKGVDA